MESLWQNKLTAAPWTSSYQLLAFLVEAFFFGYQDWLLFYIMLSPGLTAHQRRAGVEGGVCSQHSSSVCLWLLQLTFNQPHNQWWCAPPLLGSGDWPLETQHTPMHRHPVWPRRKVFLLQARDCKQRNLKLTTNTRSQLPGVILWRYPSTDLSICDLDLNYGPTSWSPWA